MQEAEIASEVEERVGHQQIYHDDPEKVALARESQESIFEKHEHYDPTIAQPEQRQRMPAVIYALIWMGLSTTMVISNKYILYTANFRYPILLSATHTIIASIFTHVLSRTTNLINNNKSLQITPRVYMFAIVPIGVAFGGSLIASNYAFLYLSVAFIEMLKAASPIFVFLVGFAFGLEKFSTKPVLAILAIAFGLAVASYGEIVFSTIGFVMQMITITLSSVKLIMMQKLLQGEKAKMDPLTSMYYTAPVCAVVTLTGALIFEIPHIRLEEIQSVGVWVLVGNIALALALCTSEVFLVGRTSGLSITLFGVLKSLLTVVASIAIWYTPVTVVQACGYAITLCALVCYKILVTPSRKQSDQVSESDFNFAKSISKLRAKSTVYTVLIASALVLTSLLLVSQMRSGTVPVGSQTTLTPTEARS